MIYIIKLNEEENKKNKFIKITKSIEDTVGNIIIDKCDENNYEDFKYFILRNSRYIEWLLVELNKIEKLSQQDIINMLGYIEDFNYKMLNLLTYIIYTNNLNYDEIVKLTQPMKSFQVN